MKNPLIIITTSDSNYQRQPNIIYRKQSIIFGIQCGFNALRHLTLGDFY